jgi:hypothetical protein
MQCHSISTFKWNLISKKSKFLSSINQLIVTGSAQQHRAEIKKKNQNLKIIMVRQNGVGDVKCVLTVKRRRPPPF